MQEVKVGHFICKNRGKWKYTIMQLFLFLPAATTKKKK